MAPLFTLICSIALLLFPVCDMTAGIFGYDFNLYNSQVELAGMTIFLCLTTVALLKRKISLNKVNTISATLMLPISFLNALFFVSSANWVIAIFIIISCGCAIVIFGNYSKHFVLKAMSGIVTVLILPLLLFLSFMTYAFSGFDVNTVVKTLQSPSGTYIAEVIDNDQGALGGNTFVDVQKLKGTIHILIGEFSKLPIRVYSGRWGEFETMHMSWEDEHTLMINGKAYNIEDETLASAT